MAEGGALWVVGDWGQYSPWSRETGVKMVKGDDGVYTGELSLPKGTKLDIKILKSTVSTTSGGDNTWSAVKYASTLNNSASYDFGEFTDNLIPNGNFEEGPVKWTPTGGIVKFDSDIPLDGQYTLRVGGCDPSQCSSDVFVIPPNQTLRLTGYIRTFQDGIDGTVAMKVVTPQQQTLFDFSVTGYAGSGESDGWRQFSKTFKTADVPIECQIVLSKAGEIGIEWYDAAFFDLLSLVST